MPAKFETNWMGGEDFTVGFAPRKSIRLRIWGSDVRIVPGAPSISFKYQRFLGRSKMAPD